MLPNQAPAVEEPIIIVRSAFGAQDTKIALNAGLYYQFQILVSYL